MNERLTKARGEIRELIAEFSKPKGPILSEEQVMKNEASFAASSLKNPNHFQRLKAIEFLEFLGGNPYAQEYLLQALADKEPNVVIKAVLALGKIGDAKAIPRLQECLKQAKSKQVVAEISRLINKFEKKEGQ